MSSKKKKVSVQRISGFHFCGGTLIDLTHVLTAAHCLVDERTVVVRPNTVSEERFKIIDIQLLYKLYL